MPASAVAENVLGTIGTVCWAIQLVPQIWKSWRTKSTEGLSPTFIIMWSVAAVFMGIYAISQNLNIPLIVQPQLFGSLTLLSWIQCQYYGKKRPLSTCIMLFVVIAAVFGGFEAGIVFAIKPSFDKGERGPVTAIGILSSAIISLALLPQYYEIYKYREVIGISVLFMTVDLMGGVFSDLSLAFKPKFDAVAGVTYSLVVLLDGIVVVLALILNPLAKKRRKRAALEQSRREASNAPQVPAQATSNIQMAKAAEGRGAAAPAVPEIVQVVEAHSRRFSCDVHEEDSRQELDDVHESTKLQRETQVVQDIISSSV